MMVNPQIEVFANSLDMSHAVAEHFQQIVTQAVSARGRFLAALSGGSTPQELYELLAQFTYRGRLPWEQMHFFWGDERCVPPEHPESNFGQAKRVTLTPLVFNSARNIVFLVTGKSKAETLAAVLASLLDPQRWPVHRIWPSDGSVIWLVDQAAASRLPRQTT